MQIEHVLTKTRQVHCLTTIRSRVGKNTSKADIWQALKLFTGTESTMGSCATRIARINGERDPNPRLQWKQNGKLPPIYITAAGGTHFDAMLSGRDTHLLSEYELDTFLPCLEQIFPGITERSRTLRKSGK